MPFDDQRSLSSPTGASLNLYTRRAEGAPRAVVQISHGLAEHAARYGRFADFLASRGFASFAHDHRGHGFTRAPDAPRGLFGTPDGGTKVVADMYAVNEAIAKEHPDLPVILFGHSMGGLIALNFLFRHAESVQAAAIWNANFSAGFLGRVAQAVLAWERFRLGSDVPSRILPRLTFQAWGKAVPEHRTLFDWLSRDPEEVDKYVADPLCGWDASVSMWQDVFGFAFAGADDRNFTAIRRDMPISLAGGAKDPATDGGKAVEALAARMTRMGFSNLVSKVYAETRHESLNEVNRNIIMADFAEWAVSNSADRTWRNTVKPLEQAFHHAMLNIYLTAKKEANYRATIFLDMVTTRGGVATARYLINASKPSDGYTHLYERGRLDLTVEALVTENERWWPLFSNDELKKARKRLSDYGYPQKAPS